MNQRVILAVEDSADDQFLTLRALRQRQVKSEIIFASDAIEAMDYLYGTGKYQGRDTSIPPHFVLLDLKLPRMDGLELLKHLRGDERTRLVPVVILTSSSELSDVMTAYSLGANSYVRKPVDFEEFADAISQIALYWISINEPPPTEPGPATAE